MRALSDNWNPRLWARDWSNKPSQAELEERRAAEAAAAQLFSVLANEHAPQSQYTLELDDSLVISGLHRPEQHREST